MPLLLLLRSVLVTRTTLAGGGSDTNAASYDLPSVTPAAGKVLLLSTSGIETLGGGTTPTPTISGTGGFSGVTWTKIADVTTVSAPGGRVTMWIGTNPTAVAGVVSISYGGNTQAATAWQLDQFTGADNTNQPAQAAATAFGNSNSPSVSLGSAPAETNAVICVVGHNLGNGTAGTGWTEYGDHQGNIDQLSMEALRWAPQTGAGTLAGSGAWAAAIAEIAVEGFVIPGIRDVWGSMPL